MTTTDRTDQQTCRGCGERPAEGPANYCARCLRGGRMVDQAEEFFYRHAGWSYRPGVETPEEGRRRTARELAAAERWAYEQGLEFEWSDDWEIDHVAEFDCYQDGPPETCEYVAAVLNGQVVGGLGCIDDATLEYRRVVEAELAWEAAGQ